MCFSEIKYYAFLKNYWGVTECVIIIMLCYDITYDTVKVAPRMQFQVFMDINLQKSAFANFFQKSAFGFLSTWCDNNILLTL